MTTCKGIEYKMPTFSEIKEKYNWFEKKIFERYERSKSVSRWIDPYCLGYDFMSYFTHIEMMAWQALRCYGKAPFYPQYPVGKYFLDFGNPIVKIGIECDGKDFHTDKKRDYNRDRDLQELGWDIYRVSGSDCNRIVYLYEHSQDMDERAVSENKNDYYYNTIEGLIECLGVRYFNQMFYGDADENMNIMSNVLRNRISIQTDEWDIGLSNAIQDYYNKYYSFKK